MNDEVKAIKAAERAQKKAEGVKAQYDKKINALKSKLGKQKKQSELESVFCKNAGKYNERISREVDRANERTERTQNAAKDF